MVNRLVSVGDDFTLPAAVKAADANLPERLSEPSLSATIASDVNPKVGAIAKQPLPLRDVTVAARGTDPIPCGSFDGLMFGTSAVLTNATLYKSSDGGVTWTAIPGAVPVDGKGQGHGIQKVLKTTDGEVLACSAGLVARSTGWASGAPTWTTVLTNPTNSYFLPWAFDGNGTKFICAHYANMESQGGDQSRYAYISTDEGRNWTQVWDTEARFGATINAQTHLHAAAYDPWEDRFFLCEGHVSAQGVYVSEDDGATWTKVAYGTSFTATPGNAPTVCVATDHGVVFGSDDAHNGIWTLERGSSAIEHVWAWNGIQNSQLLGYAHQGFRDPKTGIVYITYVSDEADLPAPVSASDGRVGSRVWTEPTPFGMWRRIAIDDQGRVLMWEQLGNQVAKGKTGGAGARAAEDPGRVLGGKVVGGRKSVAVGREAVANGDRSVAVGGGATTSTHEGTAVGADAAAVGSGQALGQGATAEAGGTAVGRLAKTVNGTAMGSDSLAPSATATAVGRGARAATDAGAAVINATAVGRDAKANNASGGGTAVGQASLASGFEATAVGAGAQATHTRSVALGKGIVSTAADQVQVGARHQEFVELAADPAAPAVNGARVYARDNGAGKTQFVVRFNTGAIQELALEGAVKSGATGARPAASTVTAGTQYYDTTLTKPIWSDGTTWRDAMGAAV